MNPFWRFSLRVYRAPGVQGACLELQDRCGADVNLLLWCCWAGATGRRLDRARLRRAVAAVDGWQRGVVAPLRQARRAIKSQPPAGLDAARAQRLRQRIGALEIELERVEQQALHDLAAPWPAPARAADPAAAIAANLARYLALLPGAAAPPTEALKALVDAGRAAASPRR